MDLVVRAKSLPAPGKTIAGGLFKTFPGGKGAHQAVAAARMEAAVSIVGRVGTDAYGYELRAVFAREGVDLTALRTTPGESTGLRLFQLDDATGETQSSQSVASHHQTNRILAAAFIAAAHAPSSSLSAQMVPSLPMPRVSEQSPPSL